MLSYQHAYHAGSLTDMHKHGCLAVLLSRLKERGAPITYVETHAGRGLYDLNAKESAKTGEAELGILKMLPRNLPPEGHPYRTALDQTRKHFGSHAYPGSPLIAKHLLGPRDQLYLMELHPQEHKALKANIRGANIHIQCGDGIAATLDLAPPKPVRGLVLVDPSFEVKSEYLAMVPFVTELHERWPQAVIALWYPILPAGLHKPMIDALTDAGMPRARLSEIHFSDLPAHHRLLGSGLYIINVPPGTDARIGSVERWFEA